MVVVYSKVSMTFVSFRDNIQLSKYYEPGNTSYSKMGLGLKTERGKDVLSK